MIMSWIRWGMPSKSQYKRLWLTKFRTNRLPIGSNVNEWSNESVPDVCPGCGDLERDATHLVTCPPKSSIDLEINNFLLEAKYTSNENSRRLTICNTNSPPRPRRWLLWPICKYPIIYRTLVCNMILQ